MRLQPYLVDIFLLISFYLIVLVDQLGYCRCCITWFLRLRMMIYNRGKSVEDSVCWRSLWEELVKQLCRETQPAIPVWAKRRVVFFSFSSYLFSLTRLGCVVVVAAVTSYSPWQQCFVCIGPYFARLPCRFPFTAHSGRRERQRKSSGWSVVFEASQSRVGPGRSQVCPFCNSPPQLSREWACLSVFLSLFFLCISSVLSCSTREAAVFLSSTFI